MSDNYKPLSDGRVYRYTATDSVPIDRLGDRRTDEQRDASQRVRPSWM